MYAYEIATFNSYMWMYGVDLLFVSKLIISFLSPSVYLSVRTKNINWVWLLSDYITVDCCIDRCCGDKY